MPIVMALGGNALLRRGQAMTRLEDAARILAGQAGTLVKPGKPK